MMTIQYFQASRPVQHISCLTEECTRYTSNAMFFRRYLGPRCPWITDHGKALPCWVYIESCFSQCSQALPHYTANTTFSREIYLFLVRFVFWHQYLSENTRVITLAFVSWLQKYCNLCGRSTNKRYIPQQSLQWKVFLLENNCVACENTVVWRFVTAFFFCILRRAGIACPFFKNSFYIYMLCSTLGFGLFGFFFSFDILSLKHLKLTLQKNFTNCGDTGQYPSHGSPKLTEKTQ